jgi:BirA family biotin operon repressor/biotin-[acetyl-CoA-carboxylase] ligase
MGSDRQRRTGELRAAHAGRDAVSQSSAAAESIGGRNRARVPDPAPAPIVMEMVEKARTSGWPFVRTMAVYEVVESTSDRAAQLVHEGADALPLAVWSRTQTRGRGRGSHQWWSDAGSLTFTMAIDPAAHGLAYEHEPKLALAAAVAVIDALRELKLDRPTLGIRWPNDLEVDGLKLGGILPERVETVHGRRFLIGIGLNVQTDLAAAPEEIRAMATSLATLHAGRVDLETMPRLLWVILEHFESVLGRLVDGDPGLAERWNGLDLLRDNWVSVDLGTHVVAGWGRRIDPSGALWLDDGRHEFRIFGGRVVRTLSEEPRPF